MPRFVENVLTVAEARTKTGRANAKILIDELGNKSFKYDPTSPLPDDGGKTAIKPTSLGNNPGAWVNVSRATRYFNKQGEIVVPARVFLDSYTPTSNPFTIDISKAGFSVVPTFPQIEVMEAPRTNNDYAAAKITAVTDKQLTVQITRPGTAALALGRIVKVGENPASDPLSGVTLLVRVEGI